MDINAVQEEWREVPGSPELLASSFGRVMRKPHTKRGRTYTSEPTFGYDNDGRMIVRYRGIGTVKVHRAVCLAFNGEPPPGKPYVLHDDEDFTNNEPKNLVWGTQKENLNAPGFIAYCKTRTGENNPRIKGELQYV